MDRQPPSVGHALPRPCPVPPRGQGRGRPCAPPSPPQCTATGPRSRALVVGLFTRHFRCTGTAPSRTDRGLSNRHRPKRRRALSCGGVPGRSGDEEAKRRCSGLLSGLGGRTAGVPRRWNLLRVCAPHGPGAFSLSFEGSVPVVVRRRRTAGRCGRGQGRCHCAFPQPKPPPPATAHFTACAHRPHDPGLRDPEGSITDDVGSVVHGCGITGRDMLPIGGALQSARCSLCSAVYPCTFVLLLPHTHVCSWVCRCMCSCAGAVSWSDPPAPSWGLPLRWPCDSPQRVGTCRTPPSLCAVLHSCHLHTSSGGCHAAIRSSADITARAPREGVTHARPCGRWCHRRSMMEIGPEAAAPARRRLWPSTGP